MTYNTSRSQLILKEYGRHVQQLIEHCKNLKDPEKKKKTANAIIELMAQLNPHNKNVEDYKHKLWDYLFYISGYELEVDSPYPKPEVEDPTKKLDHIGYPKQKMKFRHYGKNVERLVESASNMEDPEKQKAFAESIGNYMKMVHKNFNEENVSDEVIIRDLQTLSDQALNLSDESNLDALSRSNRSRRPNNWSNNRSGPNRGKRNHQRNNNRRRRRN